VLVGPSSIRRVCAFGWIGAGGDFGFRTVDGGKGLFEVWRVPRLEERGGVREAQEAWCSVGIVGVEYFMRCLSGSLVCCKLQASEAR
jgi:hypothetical protein